MPFNNKTSDLSTPSAPKLSYNQNLMKGRGYSDANIHSNAARSHHHHTGGDSHHYGNSGGGVTCFPAETKVLTPDGWRAISEIGIGDAVLCLDDDLRLQQGIVEGHITHPPQAIAQVVMANGTFIAATLTHAILTGSGWLRIGQLKFGDLVMYVDEDGRLASARVERIDKVVRHANAHNLIVGWHLNFIVRGAIAHSFSYARRLRTLLHRYARVPRQQTAGGTRISNPSNSAWLALLGQQDSPPARTALASAAACASLGQIGAWYPPEDPAGDALSVEPLDDRHTGKARTDRPRCAHRQAHARVSRA